MREYLKQGKLQLENRPKFLRSVFFFIWLIYIIQVHWRNIASQMLKCTSAKCYHNLSNRLCWNPPWFLSFLQCFSFQRRTSASDVGVLKCRYTCLLNLYLIAEVNQYTVLTFPKCFLWKNNSSRWPIEGQKKHCPVTKLSWEKLSPPVFTKHVSI